MLKLLGAPDRESSFCDRHSRRSLLNIGTFNAIGAAAGAGWSVGATAAPPAFSSLYLSAL